MAMTHAHSGAHLNPHDFRLHRATARTVVKQARTARVGDDVVVLRPPHLLDGPAWRQTCLREAGRLKASLGSPDMDWDESVTLTAWADKVTTQQAAARAGRLVPLVLTSDTGDLLGEISFAIDPRTGVAEMSIWLSDTAPAPARTWAWRESVNLVLTLPGDIRGVVAPVAVDNAGPVRMLAELGFTRRATSQRLRLFDGTPTDHDIWWLSSTTPVTTAPVFTLPHANRPPAATMHSCALMALPGARVAARRARRLLRRSRKSAPRPVGSLGRRVQLPDSGFGTVTIDGAAAGVADVRHDRGSSTLEVWTDLKGSSAANDVARELLDLAELTGVRRLAWSVLPGSVELVAAISIGLTLEGQTSPPVWAAGTTHELRARVLKQPPT